MLGNPDLRNTSYELIQYRHTGNPDPRIKNSNSLHNLHHNVEHPVSLQNLNYWNGEGVKQTKYKSFGGPGSGHKALASNFMGMDHEINLQNSANAGVYGSVMENKGNDGPRRPDIDNSLNGSNSTFQRLKPPQRILSHYWTRGLLGKSYSDF